MSSKSKNKRGDRRARQNKSSGARSTDMLIMNSHKATGSTTTVVLSDVDYKRQNFNVVQTPPRQLANQIYWTELSNDSQLSASATGPTEANFAFQGSNISGFSDFTSCFDQYCLYSVTATFVCISNVSTPVRLYTALDYDSVSNVGKGGIFDFSTFDYASLAGNGSTSLVRMVKPCIAPQITSSGTVPVAGGISRAWLDCAYPSITHYGIRSVIDQWVSTTPNVVEVTFTYCFGFRNNV